MELNLVHLVERDGFYEYDFYPNRKFDGESHILMYDQEMYGNLEFCWHFHQCDKKNIQVIVYTPLVMFPLASLCSHKCRMVKASVCDAFYSDNGGTRFDVKFDVVEPMNVWCIPKNYNMWALYLAVDKCFQRSIYMDQTAFERFQNAKGMFKEGMVCIETKRGRQFPPHLFDFADDVVGLDHQFQCEIMKKYQGEDCYLSFQILASLFSGVAYVGLSGAGSLFTLALPVNTILIIDTGTNTPEEHRLIKSKINQQLFGIPTHGFDWFITFFGHGDWQSGWRKTMIEEAFASVAAIKVPEVKINYLDI